MSADREINRLAYEAVSLAQEIVIDTSKPGASVILAMAAKARSEAARALIALVNVDPKKEADIRALQGEIHRFNEIVTWLQEFVTVGIEEYNRISPEEEEEMRDLLMRADENLKQHNYEDS